jgi:hypothetical protein
VREMKKKKKKLFDPANDIIPVSGKIRRREA